MKKIIAKIISPGRALFPFLLFSLLLAACSGGGSESSDTARVGLTIKVPSASGKTSTADRAKSHASAPTQIAAIAVNVADANGTQLTSTRVAVSPGQEVTLTLEVPAGRARIFTVQALDETGTVLFQGQVSADLTAGVSTTLAIQMSPLNRPTLSINPTTLSILIGKTQLFTATLTGPADSALIWSVNNVVNGNPVLGTIIPSDEGTTAVYTAPAAIPDLNPITIKVNSASNPELAATAVVTLLAPITTVFVNGAIGVDSSECGAENSPCKTITQGLAVAEAGQTLLVAPGTYPFGNGTGEEPAPLTMKPGVDIQGGGMETTILDLDGTTDPDGAGILGADNATLSGFTIQDDDSIDFHVSLTGTTTLADNRFLDLCDGCTSTAVRVHGTGASILTGNTFGQVEDGLTTALLVEETASPTITRNTFSRNDTAIEVRSSATPMLELNSIIGNRVGISILGSSSPDLGGGARNSKGKNIISCNIIADVTVTDLVQTIHAQGNSWDHFPPTVSSEPGSGIDIVGEGINAKEAISVSPRCLAEPPTVPLNLIAAARSQNQVSLSWSASIDNFGKINYQIDRCQRANCTDFEQIAETAETSFNDTPLSASTTYTYRVRATDVDDNFSPYSNTAGATTPDEDAPTPPTDLKANVVSETEINLSWRASTDDVGVVGYRLERCQGVDCTNFVEIFQTTALSFADLGRIGISYSYRVLAVDAAGNFSGYSNTATAIILDTTAPTPPTKLAAVALNPSEISLSWEASTDNVSVAGYEIERCLVTGLCNRIDVGLTLNHIDRGLLTATGYLYRVRAYDASANVSLYSEVARVTTGSILFRAHFDNDSVDKEPDTTLPGDPVGDLLELNTSAGAILVRSSVGELTKKPVELNQTGGTGGVRLSGRVAGTPPKSGIYTARWRSLVASQSVAFAPIVLRDSSGRILASVAYRPGGMLDYNDKNPNGIGVGWKPNLPQFFEIEVDLIKKVTTLRIDGRVVIQGFPFYEEIAADLARISMELGTTEKQTLAWDDIEIVANVP